MRMLAAWLFAALVSLGGPRADAQAADEAPRARALFRAGASAYKAGNFAAAVQAFDQAHALDPKPAIRFSAAQALRRWYAVSEDPAHLVRALQYYREYLGAVTTGGRVLDASRAKNEIEVLLAQLGVASPLDGEAAAPGASGVVPLRRGTLMVDGPELAGVRVTIDGVEQEGWPVFAELAPGRYAVRVEAPGYRPLERSANAVAGQLTPLEANLEELPAKVTIQSLDDAEIIVDGRPMGRAPLIDPLELPSGRHRVVIGRSGHEVFSREIAMARGSDVVVEAELPMTSQRITAWTLFAAGALGAGAGTTLAALAVSARSEAKDVLDAAEAEQRPLSVAEAGSYNDALARRDDFSQAAGAVFSLSALTAGVGLLLYVLDDPDLYQATAGDQALLGRRWQVGVAPAPGDPAVAGGVLSVQGRF